MQNISHTHTLRHRQVKISNAKLNLTISQHLQVAKATLLAQLYSGERGEEESSTPTVTQSVTRFKRTWKREKCTMKMRIE